MGGALRIPEDDDVLQAIGVSPEIQPDGDVREVCLSDEAGGELRLSYDPVGRSVRTRWLRDGEVILDLFREGAVSVDIRSEGKDVYFAIEFMGDGWSGRMNVAVFPTISIKDKFLLV